MSRLPSGDRAGVQQGARRLPGRPGVLFELPQSAQLGAGQAAEGQRARARRRRRSATRCHAARDLGQAVRGEPEGSASCAPRATTPPTSRGRERCSTLPFKDGECLLCHNPHASENPTLLKSKGNDLCVTCHKEKAAPSSFKHAPVASEQGCLSCHSAALVGQREAADGRRRAALCLSCHAKTKEAVAEGEDAACARRGRRSAPPATTPHGSNVEGHPAGPDGSRLLRLPRRRRDEVRQDLHAQAGPRRRVLVVPPAARVRRAEAAEGRRLEALRVVSRGADEAARRRGAKHGPFVEGMCLTCHNPHGSNVKGMAADTIGTLCAGCHSDVKDSGRRRASRSTARSSTGECTRVPQPAPDRARRASCWRRRPTCASTATRRSRRRWTEDACTRRPRGTASAVTSRTRRPRTG